MRYIIQNDSSKEDRVVFSAIANLLDREILDGQDFKGVATFRGGFMICRIDNKGSIRFVVQDMKF